MASISHGIVAQSIGGGGGLLQSTATISTASSGYKNGSPISDPTGGQTIGGQNYGSVPATVTVINKGNISTYGGYAGAKTAASSSDATELGGGIAILAQSIGGGGGTNSGVGATGAIGAGKSASSAGLKSSSSEDGSNGGAVNVINSGNLATTGSEAHGIVAQSIGGGGGQGRNKKGLFHTVGGSGGGGGYGGVVKVTTEANTAITLKGDYAIGIVGQSVGGGGGVGGQATAWGIGFSSSTGGSGGPGGDGGNIYVTQSGSGTKGASDYSVVSTKGDHGTGILVQSIGGGGGVGGNGKSTSVGAGVSISSAHGGSGEHGGGGGDAKVDINGVVSTSGTDAQGIVIQSIGASGGSGGQASSKAIAAGVPFDEDGNTISLSISMAHGGTGGAGGDGGTAEANIYKTSRIITTGDGAAGLVIQSIGGGGGNGGDATASSVSKSITSWLNDGDDDDDDDADTDEDEGMNFAVSVNSYLGGTGGGAGSGDKVSVSHVGAISTTGNYADGILAHSIGGGGGNAGTGSGSTKAAKGIKSAAFNVGLGASGGKGNSGGSVDVHMDDSAASIYTRGHVSRGIFAQSIGGGGGSSSGGGGMGDADWGLTIGLGASGEAGGDGGSVVISSEGTIVTRGDWSDAILAQSIGGGGGAAGSGKSSLSIKQDEDDDSDDDDDDAESADESMFVFASSDDDDDSDDDSDSDDKALTFGVTVGGAGGYGGYGGSVTIGQDSSGTVVGTGTIHTYGTMSSGIVAQSIGAGGGSVAVSSGSDDSDDSSSSSSSDSSDSSSCDSSSSSSSSDDSSSGDKDSCINLTLGSVGGDGGDGGDVSVYASNIYTAGFASHGVVAQSIGGGGGGGVSSGLAVSKVKIKLGGGGSSSGGEGGAVTVTTLAGSKIETKGEASHGIVAHSIGGGGGLGMVALGTASKVNDDTLKDILSVKLGTSGYPPTSRDSVDGEAVTISHKGALSTAGERAVGIVAQSIGGGGGFVTASEAVLNSVSFETKQARAGSRDVTVTLHDGASIVTSGDGGVGILAQSVAGGGGVAADLNAKLNTYYVDFDKGTYTSSGYGGYNHQSGTVTVSVNSGTSIATTGKYAHGIIAQSVAGTGAFLRRTARPMPDRSTATAITAMGSSA
nr:hypothetical protein [Marinicella sp. W31]MDC2876799.1 hypothetical protein [Marinicella sp. W31]